MGNGVHQVGFAQTNAAIKKQGVERYRTAFSHTAGGGMRQFVGLTHHKGVKGKTSIQRRAWQFFVQRAGRARQRAGKGFLHLGLGGGRIAANGKLNALHRSTRLLQFAQNMVGKIARDPIAEERCWHFKLGDTIRQGLQL